MSYRNRITRLTGRPVLVSELHAPLMISTARAPDGGDRVSDGLFGSVRRLLGGDRDARRAPSAQADHLEGLEIQAGAFDAPPCAPNAERMAGWWMEAAAAIIDIDGPLWDRGYGWGDGYDEIAQALREARADERVMAILLRISSPGGLVDGLFDLVSEISQGAARAGGKPIWAFVAGGAFSAGYAIAAACDRIISSPEGEVGSIGAVLIHLSEAGWLADNGIELTAIEYPEGKTEAASFKALSDAAKADLGGRIRRAADLFIDHVSRHRAIEADAITALRARVFTATDADPSRSALKLGLIDDVMFERDVIAALLAGEPAPANPDPVTAPLAAESRAAGLRAVQAAEPQAEIEMDHAKKLAMLRAKAQTGDPEAVKALQAMEAMLAAIDDEEDTAETEEEPTAAAPEDDEEMEDEDDAPTTASPGLPGAKVVLAMMTSAEAQANPKLAGVLAGTPGMTLARFKTAMKAGGASAKRKSFSAPDPAVMPDGAAATGAIPVRTGNADCDEALAAFVALRGEGVVRSQKA